MQIVIDIPEEYYNATKAIPNIQCDADMLIIKSGTPLPKGHGRLVDMSEVLIKLMQFYDGDKTIGQCLDEVNTIIEADRSERSDKE